MMVKVLAGMLASLCVLTCTASWGQTRTSGARYYSASYGNPMGRFSMAGHHHHAGCADCAVEGPIHYEGHCGPDCHGCRPCCPRILPALARGVGAVADFVGGTLDAIFCAPCGGCGRCGDCCGPRHGCCVRRPIHCGCDSCGPSCCEPGISVHDGPVEVVPSGPSEPVPAQARVSRPQASNRAIVAPRVIATRKPATTNYASTKATKAQRTYAAVPASAEQEVVPEAAEPATLDVDTRGAVALNPFDADDAPVRVTRTASPTRTATVRPTSTRPANPLRTAR
ncbi:MAG: hypothetical protein RLY70_4286 [Planctomycetota bacterium]|jgi:hypothetical protein